MPRNAVATILLVAACLWAAGCSPPGKGAKAEAGYRDAAPVIAALKQYHDRHNGYPAALRELVPDYLSESAWRTSEGKPASDFFEYKIIGASYELKFSYTGPGMNHCFYRPEAARWECFGYY